MLNSRWSNTKASVLASTNIVELIGQSVALKRAGKDYVGLCPFHQEKTPSFHVSPIKRRFYCFGCRAKGNAIDFVMKRDSIDFVAAMRRLAGGSAFVARAAPAPPPPQRDRPTCPVGFDHLALALTHSVNPVRLEKLAVALGVGAESLRRLNIGWAGDRFCMKCFLGRTAWSFPMRDELQKGVLGIRLRFVDCDHKSSIKGGHEGLFIPNDLGHEIDRLFLCEGPTDTAAMLDLGFAAVGRPSSHLGNVTLVWDLIKSRRVHSLVIFADGDASGQGGAAQLAGRARLYNSDVRIITPPAGIKDARAWKQSGATAADILSAIKVAPPRRLHIVNHISASKEGSSR